MLQTETSTAASMELTKALSVPAELFQACVSLWGNLIYRTLEMFRLPLPKPAPRFVCSATTTRWAGGRKKPPNYTSMAPCKTSQEAPRCPVCTPDPRPLHLPGASVGSRSDPVAAGPRCGDLGIPMLRECERGRQGPKDHSSDPLWRQFRIPSCDS